MEKTGFSAIGGPVPGPVAMPSTEIMHTRHSNSAVQRPACKGVACAIMMLDEALRNRQAAPISPLEKLALAPKHVYDPGKPDAHQ